MIHFCKKSLHSFFNNVTSCTSQQHSSTPDHCRNTMPFGGVGLSVLANYDDFPKPNNVVQSLCFINGSRKIKEALELEKNKRDHVEIRIKGLGGGDADGLGSCTESLGFESCTERSVSNEYGIDFYDKTRVNKKSKIVERRKEWNFPPPLNSLDDNGKPMFVLKPVRKDGRLELTEVQIHRQESLHACREDGRLRMYLVELNPTNDGEISVDTEDELSDTKEIKLADTKEKLVVEEEWKFPENCGGGEDCRWLNEMVVSHGDHHHHHHHHNMHGWGQQCVTIR
ncbi:The fantastic four family [Heracleum sosnowskyi]|uniref:The fantastic four family n=1 Tax=Heracleum sosnowskyi TaxID=360622 RepID=A0AAD8H5Y7_9APIA|nr:The fantastic four family [Heracleum sosnowskyi]